MIICVNNNKGGTLKTTSVTNLAGVLAKEGNRVLIVDADNQSNVAVSFGLNPDKMKHSLYDVLVEFLPAHEAIVNVYPNIDVLPSGDDMVAFDFKVIGNKKDFINPFLVMKTALSGIAKEYDYVLIDTPPSLSLIVGNAFCFADKVLIPYAPETYSMRSLTKVVETINDFRKQHNPRLEVMGIVATMVKAQTNLHASVLDLTKKYADKRGIKLYNTVIPSTVQFSNSVAYNKLPATLLKRPDKAVAYYDLWKEIQEAQ